MADEVDAEAIAAGLDEMGAPSDAAAVRRLAARVAELEGAIRHVLAQRGDDLCWMDVYVELGRLVGVESRPELLPADVMLANCRRFVASLKGGPPYRPT